MQCKALVLLFGCALALPVAAQVPAAPLVTQPIDDSSLVTLRGSVHPLSRAGVDRGAVPDSFAVGSVLFLLNRPPERQAALEQFLQAAHTQGSPGYHQWLTPEQFGRQFGAADSDVDTASAWLASHGFNVTRTSKSRQFIQFSGTAGALRSAFHTEIHQYAVNGETEYANATELEIPTALSPLVKGVSPLNSFRAKPELRVLGQGTYSPASYRVTPQFTLSNGSSNFYAVAPEDFATQYDLAPLYKSGVNGAGQTIGIINESNLDLTLVQAYQKLFSLSSGAPQLIIDGSDPGTLPDVSVESYLDVEEAGAIAPGATVNLYIGNTSGLFSGTPLGAESVVDPLYMAALRAVDDNQAGVLSVSFGNCEGFLLASGNALWSELWQQAAAQGQTVLVSSGDSGSAGCDDAIDQWTTQYGLAVNGIASTPWDVAVGGTDFYYSDYATGGASIAGLWNQANDADNGSLKAPLPEQVWDTVYGFNAIGPYQQVSNVAIPAGGGGASSCINSVAAAVSGGMPFACDAVPASTLLYGYAKPGWQSGTGVPADGVRDLPDVSLFAAAASNFSAYPICAQVGDCVPGSNGEGTVTLVGGTSASAPAMAAIMALVDQKYGRQGQADFTLYALAQKTPSAFHDVTLGSNNMTCLQGTPGPGCLPDTNGDGFYSLQKYSATPGFDLASGLGSVDANVLVNNWNSIAFKSTTTSLQISPTTAAHTSPITFTIAVKPSSGSGTPQGSVTLMADLASAAAQPAGVFILASGGAGGSISSLPGGTYEVWAQYSGDGTFAGSQSQPQTVTITPASSNLNLYGFEVPGQTLNAAAPCLILPNQPLAEESVNFGSWGPWPSGSSFSYYQVAPVAILNGAWPSLGTSSTGNVTFTVDGTPQATVAVNSMGYAAWIPPSTFNAGTHTIAAGYSGDASFNPSTATPYTAIVPQVTPTLYATPAANCGPPGNPGASETCSLSAGDTLRVEVQITMVNCHVPTGVITVNAGSLSQNVTTTEGGLLTLGLDPVGTPVMVGEAVFPNIPAGSYPVTATYAGDVNSMPATSATGSSRFGPPPVFTVIVTAPPAPLAPTTTTVSVDPTSFDDTFWSNFYYTATVTGPSGSTTPPTGSVDLFEDGFEIDSGSLTPSGPNSATITMEPNGESMDIGSSQLKAVYSGDSVYQSSVNLQNYQFTLYQSPDFLLAPQSPRLTMQAGSSATTGFNFASLGGYSGTVTLTCTTSSSLVTCSLNPAAVSLNGVATTTLTVNASAQAVALARPQRQSPARWPLEAGALAFGLWVVRRRKNVLWRSMLLSLALLAVLSVASCGGTVNSTGGGGGGGGGGNVNAPASYTVTVTATAPGLVHNAVITVVVP